MATIGNSNPTYSDVASRMDPSGGIETQIVELLNETNPILEDATVLESNLTMAHRTTARSGLPTVTWKRLNRGVQPSKSKTVQVTDGIGKVEALSQVDKAVADLNGNTANWRLSESRPFLEAMSQEMASTLFYGNDKIDPEKFTGLSDRFSDANAQNGENIINGGGSGSDNTSVWLCVWSPTTAHFTFPKGSRAGLAHHDRGMQIITQDDGARLEVYEDKYEWSLGLSVRDWRYIVRIANIDVSALTKDAASGADLIDLMVQAEEQIRNLGMGRAVFYTGKTVRSYLRRQITNKKNVYLSFDTVAGKRVLAFDEIPVRRCDALLETESAVSFT